MSTQTLSRISGSKPRRLYLLVIFIGALCFSRPLEVAAQDSIPEPPHFSSNHSISHLKRSFDHRGIDADEASGLLQASKDLNYVPGQIVALCQLATVYDAQQPDLSAKNLQQARALAPQVTDFSETGWAMGQIGRIQQKNPTISADLRNGLIDMIRLLGQSMRNVKIRVHQKPPGKPDADEAETNDEDNIDLSDLKIDKMIKQGLKIGRPYTPRPPKPNFNFSDEWLDSLIVKGHTNKINVKRLIAQKASRDSSRALSNEFAKKGNYAEAYKYFLNYSSYKDSLTAEVASRRVAALQYNQQLVKKEAEIKLLTKDRQLKEQAASRQWFYMFTMFACIAALVTILLILNRNNRNKRKANEQLNLQKEELETALNDLKNAQTQLVHSEKMASLGELTAGIAHEIQNPLNFVNNFSEVSAELVQELIENQRLPELDREMDIELLGDVELNLQKISMHGKRASAIIKGMLEHSRSGSGEKEQTDPDALIDEYLKLSYHGMRAKDKFFEAKFVTDLKGGRGTVNIVPQEIGRVLLNIFNNAFYAVQQKHKIHPNGFEPVVTVKSYREDGELIIKIKDNGSGMPEQVKQKIFQPFFTTKPTGEGTGLGLSLSYDIITKGHSGQLSVISEPGNYTEFTIVLPA